MKALLITALLFTSLAVSAREGHEGPEATPVRPSSPVVAKVVTGAGFAPPAAPRATIVQIRENGTVERIRDYQGRQPSTQLIALLSKKVAEKIAQTAAAVEKTDVRDPRPENPGCMDAPSTTYYAVQGANEIVIAARENCKDLEKVDESAADRDLKRALDAVSALATLAR